jgi:hypothetical protein
MRKNECLIIPTKLIKKKVSKIAMDKKYLSTFFFEIFFNFFSIF